ncbi:MAG: hypothetical protein HUK15_04880, partial [Bacteroidales bacterium]|nr:hypothetical protein [Bacteroidales bacterium]
MKGLFCKKISILTTLIFGASMLFAQYEFIENKGQWDENINFKMELNDGALFLEDQAVTFNLQDIKMGHHSHAHDEYEWQDDNPTKRGHAYKMILRNSNKPKQILASNKTTDYNNYFIGNDESKWASHVEKYRNVKYTDIYNNIDLLFSSSP